MAVYKVHKCIKIIWLKIIGKPWPCFLTKKFCSISDEADALFHPVCIVVVCFFFALIPGMYLYCSVWGSGNFGSYKVRKTYIHHFVTSTAKKYLVYDKHTYDFLHRKLHACVTIVWINLCRRSNSVILWTKIEFKILKKYNFLMSKLVLI